MATKPKTAADAAPVETAATPTMPLDPAAIAVEAEKTAAAIATQRRAVLAKLAQATQIPEADLLLLFGLPA